MKQKRKIFAILVALAMLIGGIPVGAFDVHAAEEHSECTARSLPEGSEWTLLDENTTELEAYKYYYLEDDLILNHNISTNMDGGHAYICFNGHSIDFLDGYSFVLSSSDGGKDTVFTTNCKSTGGKVTADLEFTINLNKDARGVPTDEYNNVLKPAEFTLYYYGGTEVIAMPSVTDKTNPASWTVSFENVSLVSEEDTILSANNYDFEIGFKNYKDGKGFLAGSNSNINIQQDTESTPLHYIIGANGCIDCVIGFSLEPEDGNVDLDQNFTAIFLANGKKIKEAEFNPFEQGTPQLQYLDGAFVPSAEFDGALVDEGTIILPAYYDGVRGDYSVELVHDQYVLKLVDSKCTEYDNLYSYNFIYSVAVANKVDTVSLNMNKPQGGSTFPTNATSNNTSQYDVQSVEWTHYGNTINASTTAVEGETYTAHITVKPKDGYVISYDAEATVNGENVGGVYKHNDGTVTIEYNVLASEAAQVYTGFDGLSDVEIAFDVEESDIAIIDKLPSKVTVNTNKGTATAYVNWTTIPTIDKTDLDGQTIIAEGTIKLPDGVTNPNSVSTDITRKFNVAAAPQVEAPKADVASDTYKEDQTITLSAADGATIYYTIDGSQPTKTENNKYTKPIELTGEEGEPVSKTIVAMAVKEGNRDSESVNFDYTISIPNENPVIEVGIESVEWKGVLNDISFGLFFKKNQTVTIKATDYSEIKAVEYFVSDTIYTEEQLKSNAEAEWKTYTSPFAIEPNSKNVVYARAVDSSKAANKGYGSSNGFVVYTDSELTTDEITYTKLITAEAPVAEVDLNGNTVKEIKVGDNTLSFSDYTVSADGKITFSKEYLEELAAGDYTATISYNPMGVSYKEAEGNDAPNTTSLSLNIVGTQKNEDGSYIVDSNEDGDFEDPEDTTYIPVDTDGDGNEEFIEVTPNEDGSYTDEGDDPSADDDTTYIPVDTDGDGDIDEFVEADKNEEDGTYEDEEGNIYIPTDTDGDGEADEFIPVVPNEDGSYTDEGDDPSADDDTTYIPVDTDNDGEADEFIPVVPNEDGSYTDEGDDPSADDDTTYIPVDTDNDGEADEFIPVVPNEDGSYTDEGDDPSADDDTTYIPVDTDGDGDVDEFVEADKNEEDGTYKDEEGNIYIPTDTDGDGEADEFVEVEKNEDGSYTNEGDQDDPDDDTTYIPVDTDKDGDVDEFIEADKNDEDGTYEDEEGNIYIPTDTDNDGEADEFIPVVPNEDGSYTDEGDDPSADDDTTYIPVDTDKDGDVDGFVEADKNDEDGTYEDEEGNIYIPTDTDGDGKDDEYIDVTPNEDGSYTDDNDTPLNKDDDTTYIPVDTDKDGDVDEFIEADKNEDGSYTDEGNPDDPKDDTTYIPVDTDKDGENDEYIEVTPNEEGSFTDDNGTPDDPSDDTTYIPVDKDGDGETDEIIEVTPNEDGSFTDDNGTPDDPSDDTTYIPVDKDGDGEADEIIEVTPNGDGTYSDKEGNQYESNGEGVFVLVELTGTDTGDDMNPFIWFVIMMTAAGAAVVTRRKRA